MHCIAGSTVIYLMQATVYDMHIYCYIMLTAIVDIKNTCKYNSGDQECDTVHSDNLNNPIVCQVFYHKEGTNHWKATLAFFTKNKMDVS